MDQNSPWGMVVQSPQEWDINELQAGGVAFLRLDFPWHVLQPKATDPFQWGYFDNVVNWAAARGMWIFGGLGSTPEWAVDPVRYANDQRPWKKYSPHAYPPKDLALWENFVRQVVGRYGAKVKYWGIWNEPDSYGESPNVCFWRGTQQEFFDSIVARALKVIPADLRVCAPDLAHADVQAVPWREHWLRDLLTAFGRRLHAVTVHIYRGGGDGSDVIDGARTAKGFLDNYNSRNGTQIELWITETGWHRGDHIELEIGRRIQDLCFNVRQNPWVKKIFPYVWSDNYTDPFNFKRAPNTPGQQWTSYKFGIRGT